MESQHAPRLAPGVRVEQLGDEFLVHCTLQGTVHRVSGVAAEVLGRVVAGEPLSSPECERALSALEAADVVVFGDRLVERSLSRRRSIAMLSSAGALGLITLVLPASQVAASYEGFGAQFNADTSFGVVSGFGDGTGTYFTSTKVDLRPLSAVSRVRITVAGGAGGPTTARVNGTVRGEPGRGALVQVVLSLGELTHLHLYVGSRGGVSQVQDAGLVGTTGMPSLTNSYNGGGGGAAGNAVGGGGGAASLVFTGNGSSNSSLVAIAGGGGGGGGGFSTSSANQAIPGGAGGNGGRVGTAGSAGSSSATGGGGGTQSAGGAAGSGAVVGNAGTTAGGGGSSASANNGGGGGGGQFGGGGGGGDGYSGTAAGGGGGASFLLSGIGGTADGHYYATNSIVESGWIRLEFD